MEHLKVTAPPIQVEFSRCVAVEQLGIAPIAQTISATPEECALLARRFGLVMIDRLVASVQIRRLADNDFIRVDGRFEADVVQTCVVTLEAFPTHVEDSFSLDFTTDSEANYDEFAQEIIVDIDEEPPEPIIGGILDIGELVSQYLSLSLDPYPRAPGVALDMIWEGESSASISPFAILKKLKPDG